MAPIACPAACSSTDHTSHFLNHVSPSSATSRLRQACSLSLRGHIYSVVANAQPEQFGVLNSLLSPHMSYPLIAMCRSDPRNRLSNEIFDIGLRRKLLLPLYLRPEEEQVCSCRTTHDNMGDHVFKCTKNNKKMAHNYISDGLATALAPILATVELILPTTITPSSRPNSPTSCHAIPTSGLLIFPSNRNSYQIRRPLLIALLGWLDWTGHCYSIDSPRTSPPLNPIDVFEHVKANQR